MGLAQFPHNPDKAAVTSEALSMGFPLQPVHPTSPARYHPALPGACWEVHAPEYKTMRKHSPKSWEVADTTENKLSSKDMGHRKLYVFPFWKIYGLERGLSQVFW